MNHKRIETLNYAISWTTRAEAGLDRDLAARGAPSDDKLELRLLGETCQIPLRDARVVRDALRLMRRTFEDQLFAEVTADALDDEP